MSLPNKLSGIEAYTVHDKDHDRNGDGKQRGNSVDVRVVAGADLGINKHRERICPERCQVILDGKAVEAQHKRHENCLLYTSDAADD